MKSKSTKGMSVADWLMERTKGIGGSDAAAIAGLNPYRSAIDVWMEKTGKAEELPDNDAMRLGRDLEPYVVSRWEEITGKKARRRNAILTCEEHPFMMANIDRWVVGENAGLEIKTGSPYTSEQWADGKIPGHYEIQCHHYMAVTGAERWYLCALIFPRIECRIIERDEETIRALTDIEGRFWNNYVLPKEMPPPDGSDAAGDALKEIYPSAEHGSEMSLNSKGKDMLRYWEIDELIKTLETEQKEIKQSIQAEMGDIETAWIGEDTVTWKNQKGRTTIDAKRLKKEHPEVYEQYAKTGKDLRVFRVKKGDRK